MTDDGMLVNFAIGDEVLRPKPVFKGGRWRDRLSAKRSTKRHRPRPSSDVQVDGNSLKDTASRIVPDSSDLPERPSAPLSKRLKVNGELSSSLTTAQTPTSTANFSSSLPSKQPKHAAPKEIISSLFTYNPSSKPNTAEQPTDFTDAEPSNAPLPEAYRISRLWV